MFFYIYFLKFIFMFMKQVDKLAYILHCFQIWDS